MPKKFLVLLLIAVFLQLNGCSCSKNPSRPDGASNITKTDNNWQIPFDKAVKLLDAGKSVEASYYFSNALGASPGNYTIIEVYYKTMLKLAENDVSVLSATEGFLTSQIPLVKVEDVEKVLTLLQEVRTQISTSETAASKLNASGSFEGLLSKIKAGDFIVPQTADELQPLSEPLSDLQDYLTGINTDRETAAKVDAIVEQVQGRLKFAMLLDWLENRKKAVEESIKMSASVAEYQLQECEQVIREMIALRIAELTDKINGEIVSLRELALKISDAKSNEIWKETQIEIAKKKAERGNIQESKDAKGKFQLQLEALGQEAMLLQNILPLLSGNTLNEAIKMRDELNKEAERLSIEQSKRYNDWAIGEIQKCLGKCQGGVGWITNGKPWFKDEPSGRRTISAALIEHIGPIDRRFLTAEVSRALSEVENKYLDAKQLNPVKDDSSIKDDENILYTLKQMYEKIKTVITQF